MALLLCLPLALGSCAKHKYDAEWQAVYETCESNGFAELSSREDFDPEADIALIQDVCGKVVNELSREYQDTHPDDVPEDVRQRAFDEAFEDCLGTGFLESEPC